MKSLRPKLQADSQTMENVPRLFDLKGRVAVVTGATGLIGKRHCAALVAAGAKVVIADRDIAQCNALASELSEKNTLPTVLDVTNRDDIVALRDEILRKWGRLDILVNNAALNDSFENPLAAAELSKFENYPLELWNQALNVNVTGVFLCAQVLGSVMAEKRSGSIINVASTYGIVAPDQSIYKTPEGEQPFYKSASYPTAKGAVLSFTRFLAAYWGEKNVRVNALSPGGVENGQAPYFIKNYSAKTPLGRMAQPDDYQGALLFLASDASAYVTGANIVVDGGWTIW